MRINGIPIPQDLEHLASRGAHTMPQDLAACIDHIGEDRLVQIAQNFIRSAIDSCTRRQVIDDALAHYIEWHLNERGM